LRPHLAGGKPHLRVGWQAVGVPKNGRYILAWFGDGEAPRPQQKFNPLAQLDAEIEKEQAKLG
jgi:hypothetical protein